MVLKATQDLASQMGKRAGSSWVTSGIPTPNPFDDKRYPDLAQAWRASYLKAAGNRG